jgi:ferrous iron transport protein B
MELPPYRMPTFKSLMIHTWEKGKHFLIKAGTYILAFSIIAWFLLNLPWGVQNKKDSYLGQVGQVVAPVLEPLGFGNWAAGSSLIAGLVAKEIVVGTMAEIYVKKEDGKREAQPSFADDLKEVGTSLAKATRESFGNLFANVGITSISAVESAEKAAERNPLREELKKQFTPLAAYAFIVFVLLYVPCVVAIVAMVQELGSWKWFGVTFVYQMALAWGMAALIYQGGRLLGLGG